MAAQNNDAIYDGRCSITPIDLTAMLLRFILHYYALDLNEQLEHIILPFHFSYLLTIIRCIKSNKNIQRLLNDCFEDLGHFVS